MKDRFAVASIIVVLGGPLVALPYFIFDDEMLSAIVSFCILSVIATVVVVYDSIQKKKYKNYDTTKLNVIF